MLLEQFTFYFLSILKMFVVDFFVSMGATPVDS